MPDPSLQCLNCDAPLAGPYCAQCGQRDQHRIVPMRHLLRDLFHELVAVDHNVLRTFWILLSRPGLLTVDYLEGRRVRHLPPLRLYLLTSFLMFLSLGILTPRWVKSSGGSKTSVVTVDEPKRPAPAAPPAKVGGGEFERKMELGGRKASENPAAFMAQVVALFPKVMFILLPVFALLMKLLYVRRKLLYAAHAIFALHFHTAAYLMFMVTIALGFIPGARGWMTGALMLGLPVYLGFSLHRAYGQSWPKTLVKGLLLGAAYVPLVLTGAVAAVVWAVYRAG